MYMTDTNNTEAMLKQLMEMVAKQNEKISKLEASSIPQEPTMRDRLMGNAPTTLPQEPIGTNSVTNNSINNQIEKALAEEKNKASLLEQAKMQIRLEEEAKNFNITYGSSVDKSILDAIDKANTTEQHKLALKFKELYKEDKNKSLLTPKDRAKVDEILAMNDQELATTDITQTYFEVMEDYKHAQSLQASATMKYGSVGILNNSEPVLATQEWAKDFKIISRL